MIELEFREDCGVIEDAVRKVPYHKWEQSDLSYSLFEMPVLIKVGGVSLMEYLGDEWYPMPIYGLA